MRFQDQVRGDDSKLILRKTELDGRPGGLRHSRPLSIADSEIQQASDVDPQVLNHEMSLASLNSGAPTIANVRIGMQA